MERIEEMYNFIFIGLINHLFCQVINQSTFDKPLIFNISYSNVNIDQRRRSGYTDDNSNLIRLPSEFTKYIKLFNIFYILNYLTYFIY